MIVVVFTILSALFDTNKRFTDHTSRFVFRAIIICLISIIEVPAILVGIWKPTLFQFLFNTAIFYGIFDYILNILEKRKWNYVGDTSKIDQFINKYGSWKIQFLFKILFIIITFVLKFKII